MLQIAAGSLACRFRRSAAEFPQHQGFLKADPASVAAWRTRLAALGPGRKIGLSWQGGVGFTGRKRRSLTLEQLLPILRLPGIQFVNLQYTEVREEMRALESRHGVKVHHWQEAIDDYDQTAALVAALDSVLTVCTAIVHLTGALGRPALVMVPFGPDWRYGASGERMIWYPSVRLLRQRRIGDWSEVLRGGVIEYLFLTPAPLVSIDGQVTAFGASVRLGSLAPTRALMRLGYDARTFTTSGDASAAATRAAAQREARGVRRDVPDRGRLGRDRRRSTGACSRRFPIRAAAWCSASPTTTSTIRISATSTPRRCPNASR